MHDLAEELEHIHSEKLINQLEEFLDFPETDPHGDPIPDKNGILKSQELIPISKMNIGELGKISGVREHSKDFLQYLEKTGLILGEKIKIIDKINFDGAVVIAFANKEQSISREVAKNILIAI